MWLQVSTHSLIFVVDLRYSPSVIQVHSHSLVLWVHPPCTGEKRFVSSAPSGRVPVQISLTCKQWGTNIKFLVHTANKSGRSDTKLLGYISASQQFSGIPQGFPPT